MIRVLVADDHVEVRRQIIRLVERAGDMEVAGEAADGFEVLDLFESAAVDVLLLDLTMPRKGGIETLRELLPRHPGAKVLVVSMHPSDQLAEPMILAGAKGYLGKDRIGDCLQEAIRTIHAGGLYVDGREAPPARVAC